MSDRPVSVVTGAVGGMGRACARRFAALGDTVVATDLDVEAINAVVAELDTASNTAIGLACDLTDPAAAVELADEIRAAGRLRAVAHTAGLSPTMAGPDRILAVNLVASVRLLDALEPLAGEGTAAVCVASQAGHLLGGDNPAIAAVLAQPLADDFLARAAEAGITDPGAAYGWSKWAVRKLVVERAPVWGARGARVVSLSPGIIDTPMGRQELERQPTMPAIIDMTPLGRVGEPDEIAATIEFLCSPAASFITGTDLLVDGGSTEQVRMQIEALIAGEPSD